ncbi:MAG TPA: leucyl aminopeptidase [Acidimicrobiales bacterium]
MAKEAKPFDAAGIAVRVAPGAPDGIEALVVPVWNGRVPAHRGLVDLDLGYLAARGFEGRLGETQVLLADDGSAVVAVGLGDRDRLTTDGLRRASAASVRAVGRARSVATALLLALAQGVDGAEGAQAVVEGAALASYAFTAFKSDPRPNRLAELCLVAPQRAAKEGARRGAAVATAVRLARDLVNEPAGTLTPSRLAAVAATEARAAGLALTVLDEEGAGRAGLGGLLGVAQGSDEPPCLLELLYEPPGASAQTPTVAFVGKGITFDSGGLSLKTAQGLVSMKTDMSGAAAVLGAMTAVARLGAPVRVLGLCPLTENMPGGRAIKPGDVLKIRNGKTVEVLNTDAEGRLVLADALSLAAEAEVDAVVDLATLTGAVSTALGRNIAGLMGSDAEWINSVQVAATRAGESVWPLPLPEEYRKDIDSDVADLRNTGGGNPAGTIIAGLFLEEFSGGLPWAHLDIAGTARSDSDDGYISKGGTGFGVRTLVELATSARVPLRPGAVRRARWRGRTPVALLSASGAAVESTSNRSQARKRAVKAGAAVESTSNRRQPPKRRQGR